MEFLKNCITELIRKVHKIKVFAGENGIICENKKLPTSLIKIIIFLLLFYVKRLDNIIDHIINS